MADEEKGTEMEFAREPEEGKTYQDFHDPSVISTAVRNEDGTVTLTDKDGKQYAISAEDWRANFETEGTPGIAS